MSQRSYGSRTFISINFYENSEGQKMKNFLLILTFLVVGVALSSKATAQYYHSHQHNGIWHQHPHSAAHYHDYSGTITYYPPVTVYRGTGVWSYSPGAVVTPQRNVIIGGTFGYWQYRSCQPYTYYWPYRWR